METPINISEDSSWLSDLKMVNGYILSDKDCNLNLNMHDAVEEEEFLSNDIASVFALEKPFKQMKTMDHSDNDNITDKFSLKSATSVFSYQLPQILTFDNPNPIEFYGYDQKPNETVTSASLGNRNFSAQKSKGSSKTSPAKRSPAHIKDHIMAERKRREMLSQSFIALAALIPDLKKMDKASILAETIKYVKELKERLEILEKKGKKPKADQSTVTPIKLESYNIEDYSSSEAESVVDGTSAESLFKVEAKASEQHMLIRIHCQKHKGLLVKIISEIQSFQLLVVNNSVLAFGDSILDITIIAEIGEGYNLPIKELVHNLRMAALKFISV